MTWSIVNWNMFFLNYCYTILNTILPKLQFNVYTFLYETYSYLPIYSLATVVYLISVWVSNVKLCLMISRCEFDQNAPNLITLLNYLFSWRFIFKKHMGRIYLVSWAERETGLVVFAVTELVDKMADYTQSYTPSTWQAHTHVLGV